MRVAAVQHDIVWEDPPANFARLAPMIERAAFDGARLVVLTEMCTTGFSMDTEKIAERDKHRWELDPASSEDYDDRD